MKFNYCPPIQIPELESVTYPDGKRYYLTPDGDKFPSVTTVVGSVKKKQIMEWRKRVGDEEANRVSRVASNRGTTVHTLCERYLNNESVGSDDIMPDAFAMFRSIRPILDDINNIHYQEQALWSKSLGLAGRVDCIAEFKGQLSVIDFKTSNRIKHEEDIEDYFWQCTAYALMYEELVGIPIHNIHIIMAVEGSKPIVFSKRTEDYISGLVKVIRDYNKGLTNS